jgi:hypothetical protein
MNRYLLLEKSKLYYEATMWVGILGMCLDRDPHVLMLPRSSLNVLRVSSNVLRSLIGRGGRCE